jgi:tight adherence protein C
MYNVNLTPALALVIPLLSAVSAFLLVLSLIPSKSILVQQLDELRAPHEREGFGSPLLERIFTQERRSALARRFAEAGWYTLTPVKFVMRVIAGVGLGVVAGLLGWNVSGIGVSWMLPVLAFAAFIGGYVPVFMLNRASEARKSAIQKSLPEFLDMIASTVQAGLALNAALGYAAEAVPGPVGDEVKEALSQIRMGQSRAEALRAVGDRTNHPALRNALRVMTQAERLGANITKMLTNLAEDARHQRLMLVEEAAGKLPVKMVFPMVFFLIPAIITMIFGAVAANYIATTPH